MSTIWAIGIAEAIMPTINKAIVNPIISGWGQNFGLFALATQNIMGKIFSSPFATKNKTIAIISNTNAHISIGNFRIKT